MNSAYINSRGSSLFSEQWSVSLLRLAAAAVDDATPDNDIANEVALAAELVPAKI